jgi:hypothetical protein
MCLPNQVQKNLPKNDFRAASSTARRSPIESVFQDKAHFERQSRSEWASSC